ncbi:MAG: hypothetical protein NZ891_03245, partial [bacterium]|nr:hypothetical protein [bacterium]MDW8163741.1 hypothetical protein [Candidatus Omnitrophota bacterium]
KNTIDKFQYGLKEIPETIESLLETIREFKKRNYKNEEFSKNLSLVIKKTGIKISFSLFISSLLISWVFLYISEFFILSNIIISIVIVLIFIFFLNLRKD